MFIRYPGSKDKLRERIMAAMPDGMQRDLLLWREPVACYCEPFFGSGAITWQLLPPLAGAVDTVMVNDKDPAVADLWRSVLGDPKTLISLVQKFEPSTDAFYEFKATDGQEMDPVIRGFRKLALHQMSFSGLGAMSGGPLGGRQQKSEYNTSCRWNPDRITGKILKCHKLMKLFRKFDVRCDDFEPVLNGLPIKSFAYLDPPYYVQGAALYKYPMDDDDHARLAVCLRRAKYRWLCSYDDCSRIRELYSWAFVYSFEMTPTMQRTDKPRRKNREIVITNVPPAAQ